MSSSTVLIVLGSLLAAAAAVSLLPRLAIRRSQDRLAERTMGAGGEPFRLLTRAELVTGRWRRLPGVLGLAGEAITFDGVFGETHVIAVSRIGKIVTGRKLSSGRVLFRMEVLRISAGQGPETEFVLTPASASAWRSHLGLWAMAERVREAEAGDAERVVPGGRPA